MDLSQKVGEFTTIGSRGLRIGAEMLRLFKEGRGDRFLDPMMVSLGKENIRRLVSVLSSSARSVTSVFDRFRRCIVRDSSLHVVAGGWLIAALCCLRRIKKRQYLQVEAKFFN